MIKVISLLNDTCFLIMSVPANNTCERRTIMKTTIEPVQRTYTAEQISKILGISLRKAYEICETATEFKVLRFGKRCVRVHKESFDNWLDSQIESL